MVKYKIGVKGLGFLILTLADTIKCWGLFCDLGVSRGCKSVPGGLGERSWERKALWDGGGECSRNLKGCYCMTELFWTSLKA